MGVLPGGASTPVARPPCDRPGPARCAQLGGAVAVRINGPEDVRAVKALVDVPVIGLHKLAQPRGARRARRPRHADAVNLVERAPTSSQSKRPEKHLTTLLSLIRQIRTELGVPVMADEVDVDEGLLAGDAGAELIGTTLVGLLRHTAPTITKPGPTSGRLGDLSAKVWRTVAEGRYATVHYVEAAFNAGAFAVVVGTAITDPVAIMPPVARVAPRATTTRRHAMTALAYMLGVDIGGTKIAAAVVRSDGEAARTTCMPTPALTWPWRPSSTRRFRPRESTRHMPALGGRVRDRHRGHRRARRGHHARY